MNYKEYLQSEHWLSFRKSILLVRNRCQKCGSKEKLNLHHISYKNLGNETNDDIIVLCQLHHNKFHSLKKKWKNKLSETMDFTFAKNPEKEFYHLSNVLRDCNRCGGKHPVHYKIFKSGKKILAITCPKSHPRTEWLRYEDNLDIPTLNSRKFEKELKKKKESKPTLMGWSY